MQLQIRLSDYTMIMMCINIKLHQLTIFSHDEWLELVKSYHE